MIWLTLVLFLSGSDARAAASYDFKWCVANSAFQVEGSPQDSDWYRWTHESGKIADRTNADRVFDFWNQYGTEFNLAAELGVNAFRLSIAWERVEPRAGVWDEEALAHYEKMVLTLRSRGIDPVVTLHHFVLPQWLAEKGGLLAPDFPDEYSAFAEKVVTRLALGPSKVNWWLTFNEPVVLAQNGYLDGSWPPGHHRDTQGAIEALAQMVRAHFAAVRKIRALPGGQDLKIGFAAHWRSFQPLGSGPLSLLATRLTDWMFNRQMTDAMVTGRIFLWMPGSKLIRERLSLPEGMRSLDYIGINYYGRTMVEFTSTPPFVKASEGPGPKSDIGWEIYPEGLGTVIHQVQGYGLPMLITENGVADERDRLRPQFLNGHIRAMEEAIRDGSPVLGYCYWSLTDNFEWARGLTPKFGLVSYDPATLERKRRPSFYEYREFIRSGIGNH